MNFDMSLICLLPAAGTVQISPLLATFVANKEQRRLWAKRITVAMIGLGAWCAGVRDLAVIVGAMVAGQNLGQAAYDGTWKDGEILDVADRLTSRLTRTPAHGDV